nr:MAG: hypothetical protein [Bacteriophage sp.]
MTTAILISIICVAAATGLGMGAMIYSLMKIGSMASRLEEETLKEMSKIEKDIFEKEDIFGEEDR